MHFLLECKIFLFYDFEENDRLYVNVDRFYRNMKRVIIKEKALSRGKLKYDRFEKNGVTLLQYMTLESQIH